MADFLVTTHLELDISILHSDISLHGILQSKMTELIDANKTNRESVVRTIESDKIVYVRKWADTSSANEWIQHVISVAGDKIISHNIS